MKLDKKTLIYAGIGIAILVIGYMAFKKMGKKNEPTTDEKKSDVEEEESETPTKATPVAESVAPTKSQSVKSSEVFTEWEGDSAEIREKFKKAFGITSEDWKRMQEKREYISMRQGRMTSRDTADADIKKKLQKFASENNISYDGYLKAAESFKSHKRKFRDSAKKPVAMGETQAISKLPFRPRKKKAFGKVIETKAIASFMDFDGNDDVQVTIM